MSGRLLEHIKLALPRIVTHENYKSITPRQVRRLLEQHFAMAENELDTHKYEINDILFDHATQLTTSAGAQGAAPARPARSESARAAAAPVETVVIEDEPAAGGASEVQSSSFGDLPTELLFLIAPFLYLHELLRFLRVDRTCAGLAGDEGMWKEVYDLLPKPKERGADNNAAKKKPDHDAHDKKPHARKRMKHQALPVELRPRPAVKARRAHEAAVAASQDGVSWRDRCREYVRERCYDCGRTTEKPINGGIKLMMCRLCNMSYETHRRDRQKFISPTHVDLYFGIKKQTLKDRSLVYGYTDNPISPSFMTMNLYFLNDIQNLAKKLKREHAEAERARERERRIEERRKRREPIDISDQDKDEAKHPNNSNKDKGKKRVLPKSFAQPKRARKAAKKSPHTDEREDEQEAAEPAGPSAAPAPEAGPKRRARRVGGGRVHGVNDLSALRAS
ncbi:unnamed protein product [Vitrella brassicaformis CCMP3155]|uniref:F-box domain-containing protein n=2 Tax=Vitrella brassicaformis TaxID=1169539 RepID=A0A0G4FXY7_VITBC|nr:unnamed protein product [Vitrella brassicaformis CCMP3155]|eukprot:CEM19797.1 unnamed protein product [Vitrella brassicaformis CCMP3155]